MRTVGTLAILSLGVAVSLGVYRNFPWIRGVDTGAAASVRGAPVVGQPGAPPPANPHAAQLQALQNEAVRRAGTGLSPASMPALLAVLQQMRELGGAPEADRIASAASSALERRAEAELDQGNMQGGVDLYQVALALDPAAPGTSQLARSLLDRGRKALAKGRPSEAVRWGRKALSFAEADPGAHAFLADAFFSAGEFRPASDEYAKALSSRPDDGNLRRGLARSRARSDVRGTDARRARAATAAANAKAAAAIRGDAAAASAPPAAAPAPDDRKVPLPAAAPASATSQPTSEQ